MAGCSNPETGISGLQHFQQEISNVSIAENSRAFVGAHFHTGKEPYQKTRKRIEFHGNFDSKTFGTEAGNDRARQLAERPWTVQRTSHPFFTGRKGACERLAAVFRGMTSSTPASRRCFVISGLGGTGKSELCIKFAEDHKEEYWGVFWLDVHNATSVQQACDRIWEQCSIQNATIANVKAWLAQCTRPWLLIIDNADDASTDYSQFFPLAQHGHIILTTRNADLINVYATAGHEVLDCLEPCESRTLILNAANIPKKQWPEQQQAADALVDVLGCHPLAMIQAGTYIKSNRLGSPSEYQLLFTKRKDKLLKYHSQQQVSTYGSVFATFEVSAAQLERSQEEADADALHLLQLLAFMHYNGHTEQLFHKASLYAVKLPQLEPRVHAESLDQLSKEHVARLPAFLQQCEDEDVPRSVSRWRSACLRLVSLSLIMLHSDSNEGFLTFSMHQLVHAWALERIPEYSRGQAWITAASVLAFSSQQHAGADPFQDTISPQIRACLNHELEEFSGTMGKMESARMLFQFARVLYCIDNDICESTRLIQIVRERLGRMEEDGTDNISLELDTFAALNKLEAGDDKKAVEMLERMHLLRSETFDEGHTEMLALRHLVAKAYIRTGRSQQGATILERVTELQREVLGEKHPCRLVSRLELARAYLAHREIQKATKIVELVAIQAESLGEQDPLQAKARHLLGQTHLASGQNQRAIEMLEEAVTLRHKLHGKHHQNSLVPQHELGLAYLDDRQYQRARSILEEVVAGQGLVFDERHPRSLTSQYTLARAYIGNMQHHSAIEVLERMVALLDEKDPWRLAPECLLGETYSMVDAQNNRATEILERLVAILDEDDEYSLASRYALGWVYYVKEQKQAASEIFERIAASLEERNVWRLGSEYTLARIHVDNGERECATRILERLITLTDETHQCRIASECLLADMVPSGQEERPSEVIHLEKIVGKRLERLLRDRVDRRIVRGYRVMERWQTRIEQARAHRKGR